MFEAQGFWITYYRSQAMKRAFFKDCLIFLLLLHNNSGRVLAFSTITFHLR
jgi:hypothetical protein